MCGICGKVSLNSHEPIDDRLIHNMADVLKHRGPDDSGIYVSRLQNAQIGLGHMRLSIIDLSEAGHQPMSNEDNSMWIVFNGEIYNFQDLRKGLESKGHVFRSRSDTEVILHLYEDMGADCVNELRGMFAFAIWDEKKQRLLLARDRVGKKPLNYAVKNRSLIFGSEIKSILRDPVIRPEVDIGAMDLYLTYGYIPYPQTIFSGIKKLPPAHILIWEKGEIRLRRYWELSYKNKIKMDEIECRERILELLTEATKIRLVSDVPLGAFLSGGIDSSAVVAIMSRLTVHPVKTFSIGFENESFNELKYAKRIAKLFNTDHREYIVSADALEVLPKLIWHFNEPFADSSAIPAYYISKITREQVTVALNGDGGDESFAGYKRYAAGKIASIYRFIPASIRKNFIRPFIQRMPESTRKQDLTKYIKRFISADESSQEKRYACWMSIFDNNLKGNLYSKELNGRLKNADSWGYLCGIYGQSDAMNFIDATLFVDIMTYLPGDLLVKMDITSMANSLEARSPFLDHKLMEFAASIPPSLKLRGMTTKYILKKSLSKILPGEILYRRKQGFGVPVGDWFRNKLRNYAFETLLSEKCIKRGYFRKETVEGMLAEHVSGKIDHGQRIWCLINLELWHNMFIDSH
jgi:asparagine synthase (glutamine-hydrolysing)